MKRNIIKVSDYSVTLTGNNIWMTYWEIAEAFNVIPASVNRTIKRMFKENVFSECEHSKYIRLSNGNHAYGYSLDVVIAISFKYRTHYTNVFRKWLTDKVKEQHSPAFISFQTKDLYGC